MLVVLSVLTSVLAAGAVFYLRDGAGSAAGPMNLPGAGLAAEKGCTACHTLDGTAGIGPTWKGTYGTLRTMTNGSQRVADEAYLRESMLTPAAAVVTGFENIMLPAELSEAETAQLILLIRELGPSASE